MSAHHIYQLASANCHSFTPTVKTLSKAILAITLSSMGVAHAGDYSSVTFFGDSLTDGGYFKKSTEALGYEQSGQYTTNPDNSWATPFAESLGLNSVANTYDEDAGQQTTTGNNYAIGGARTGVDLEHDKYKDTTGKLLPVYSTSSQVDSFLANNKVDSKGLYTVWTGANDLFAILKAPSEADSIISSAVEDEVSTIKKLRDSGAEYILVGNIPDVGLTPNFVGTPLATIGNSYAVQYNKELYEGVKKTGANVIPLDTFNLLQTVARNPARYGFSNLTDKACTNLYQF